MFNNRACQFSSPLLFPSRQITRSVFDFLDLFGNFFCQRICSDWTRWKEEKAEEWVSCSSLPLTVAVFSAEGSNPCALLHDLYRTLTVPERDAVFQRQSWHGWHGTSGCSRFQLQQYLLSVCFSQLILSEENALCPFLGKGWDVSVIDGATNYGASVRARADGVLTIQFWRLLKASKCKWNFTYNLKKNLFV